MKAMLSLPRRATYADYLAAEQNSERRYEFIDGVIVAMAGGSDEHNSIATRFTTLFGIRVPRGYRSYNSNQRFWIAGTARGRYSDGSIISTSAATSSRWYRCKHTCSPRRTRGV